MRLEYFQMIDRFVEVDVGERTVAIDLQRAEREHDIRRTLSRLSADAGRAADRMHGADHRLARQSRSTGFTAMPFLIAVKEGKIRSPVLPGEELEFEGKVIHEGSGYAVGEAKGRCKGERSATRRSPTASCPIRTPSYARPWWNGGRTARNFPAQGVRASERRP